MKRKLKIELTADVIFLTMVLAACHKEFELIKEHRPVEKIDKSFTTSATTEKVETPNPTIAFVTETTFETPAIEQSGMITEEVKAPTETTEKQELVTEAGEENLDTELENNEELAEETKLPVEELPENIIAYTATNVNLRAVNNTKSLIIGTLQPHEYVYKIKSCDNNWDLVRVGDKIGYICRDYLLYTNQEYDIEHKYVLKNDIAVTTSKLNFRSGPSTSSEIKKTEITIKENEITEKDMVFKENEELRVIAEVDDEWLLVEYNGEFGYVFKEYTISLLEKLQSTYPELGIEEFDLQKVVYPNCELNMRKEDNIESERIRSLEFGESVRVYGEYSDWYLIMTNEHEFGFIHKDYVTELDGKTTIIDKSEQRMYMYNGNERLTYTPVTTGKDGTETDTGIFHIYYMATDIYLNDDKDWVEYWMNYNNSEGIHDAWWRQVYGEQDYHWNGSHGCDNTPYAAVKTMYNNSEIGQRVIVQI